MASKKHTLHTVLFLFRVSLLTIFSVLVLYVALAFLFSFLPTHPPVKDCSPSNHIYFNTNGIHVDVILPIGYIDPGFRRQLGILPLSRYVAFGWGDRNFYIKTPEWSDLTFPV